MRASHWIFLFAIGLILSGYFFLGQQASGDSHKRKLSDSKKYYSEIKSTARLYSQSAVESYSTGLLPEIPSQGLFSFIFKGDSLVWWSDNQLYPSLSDTSDKIFFSQNGWYKTSMYRKNELTCLTYVLIKKQYPITNRFLKNEFNPKLGICDYWEIVSPTKGGAEAIEPHDGFYLERSSAIPISSPISNWLLFCGVALLFVGALKFMLEKGISWLLSFWGMTVVLLFIRWFASDMLQALPFSQWLFFRPDIYASEWLLKSPADLFLVAMVLLLSAWVFQNRTPEKTRNSTSMLFIKMIIGCGFILSSTWLAWGLVLDSRISFDFNTVFSWNTYSFYGFFVLGLLVLTGFLISRTVYRSFQRSGLGLRTKSAFLLSIPIAIAAILLFSNSELGNTLSIVLVSWAILMLCFSVVLIRLSGFNAYMTLLAATSLVAAGLLFWLDQNRERDYRVIMASRLETEKDRIAEYLFNDVLQSVRNDNKLATFFAQSQKQTDNNIAFEEIERRVLRNHLNGYWERYDITIRCFDSNGIPFNAMGDPTWSLELYDQQIRQTGNDTVRHGLFHTGGASGKHNYTGRIGVYSADSLVGTIAVAMSSKPLVDRYGFPELLISESVPQQKPLGDYSYAFYRNDTLVNQAGIFPYPIEMDPINPKSQLEGSGFFKFGGYSHYALQTIPGSYLLISLPLKGAYYLLTTFSYLFAFYGLLFVFVFALTSWFRSGWKWRLGIGSRIRIHLVLAVVVTMVVTGGATVFYVYNTYQSAGGPETEGRIRSILSVLRNEIDTRYAGMPFLGGDEMSFSMSGLAKSLGTDFNLYNQGGRLLYSSQPKLYDFHVVAPLMDRKAFYQLKSNHASFIAQREQIGGFEYLSSYAPIREADGTTKGYINLSYFSQQSELEKRISGFLVAVLNLYVLLFAFASFGTVFLSSRLTKPLEVIRSRISGITFGKKNELIEWERDDEIGALVKEYNRKATELSAAAEQLARSERELAWREMARQVAHEIKNPLTPMRLGIQHLQRAWKENHPDKDQITERMTNVLIEQIDALSHIATEFSSFAQMPTAKHSTFALDDVLRSVVDLYAEHDFVKVDYVKKDPSPHPVHADKEQMLRVFGNLAKNAVQAVEAKGSGSVEISIARYGEKIQVTVKDTGTGISEELKPRIFTPNFTTKSGGTGLGLAMCYQMVSLSGGRIWFESSLGEGTSFHVELPGAVA
ncbi:MAG: ATP-binding protein [Bacteroidota bacterium]